MTRTRPGEGSHRAAVITCSDSASAGRGPDTSGPLAAELLGALGHDVVPVVVVPDDRGAIAAAVRAAIGRGATVVVTTGGTGAGPRDVTPEALRDLCLVELPGLGEAIRAASRAQVPTADLSRTLGGLVDAAVVLALPGSPGGVRDGLAAVGPLLGHAADMARGGGHPGSHRATAAGLVTADPFTQARLADDVARDAAGAVVTFSGIVRNHDGGREVVALHYEAHPDAAGILGGIVTDALDRPGVLAASARHRVGDLEIGDLAFAASVSAAHRGEAFAACSWLVDEVKARVPIWKHQRFADGTDEWVNSP